MANHMKGEVAFQALGREFVFRLGVNEMIELQNALGVSDEDLGAVFEERRMRNAKHVRAVTFFGLRLRHPEITLEQAGDIVADIGLTEMFRVILRAMRWALPEKDPGLDGGAPRPSVGPTSS